MPNPAPATSFAFHSTYRSTTNSGTILYRAHSTPDGHADRTTAAALALRAAQTAPAPSRASSVGRKFRHIGRKRRFLPPERTVAIFH